MAQITYIWDNTDVLANANAINQRCSYRQKSVGGGWLTAGFTPANDMNVNVTTATSPNSLLSNVVYEGKTEAICTVNGPIMNDNGIGEWISFSCIAPIITKTDIAVHAVLDVTGLDITKAKFTLKKSSDNSIIDTQTINKAGTSITYDYTGLSALTNYYIQIELYSTVNTIEIISSSIDYLGSSCSPYAFTTNASAICNPITNLTISSVEIP